MATISPPHPPNDPDLEVKVKKALERVSENIHISANEPSLAVYRLQEHVRRALPPTVTRRQHVTSLHSQLQGACYDVEYALGAVRGMQDSNEKFLSLVELLKNSIFLRQQAQIRTDSKIEEVFLSPQHRLPITSKLSYEQLRPVLISDSVCLMMLKPFEAFRVKAFLCNMHCACINKDFSLVFSHSGESK
ncbi:BLOC-1-related complex subunit 8-like [Macrobrachium nipponense]|uniref:BLOC-1-related complex subunit 8-like n=1 Tax=Macrobrachium nipponense TaxID=159736 RepID=UPI0030C88140